MTAPKPATQALKAWCRTDPQAPPYMTAYVWMRRNGATVDEVIDYYRTKPERKPVTQICKELGISYRAVAMRANRIGIPMLQVIEERKGDLRTAKQKAIDAGLKPGSLWCCMRRKGLTADEAVDFMLKNKAKPGRGITEAAKKYGLKYQRVFAYVEYHGCTPEEAAQAIVEREKLRTPTVRTRTQPPAAITRAW